MARQTLLPALLATAAALAFSGCGSDSSSGDEAEVQATVEEYLDALRAGDAEAVCALLSESELADLEVAGSCSEVLTQGLAVVAEEEVEIPEYVIGDVVVDGEEAEVRLASDATDETVPLAKEDGEWKLTGTTSLDQFHPDDPLPGGPPD